MKERKWINYRICCHIVLLFRRSVVSDSLQPRGLQHTRLPCPSPSPGACSNSRPSSQWCHPTISPSVIPFSSCPQSFPVSGAFQMSQLFASGGQSIGASASASVLPVTIQGWFPLRLTGLLSIQVPVLLASAVTWVKVWGESPQQHPHSLPCFPMFSFTVWGSLPTNSWRVRPPVNWIEVLFIWRVLWDLRSECLFNIFTSNSPWKIQRKEKTNPRLDCSVLNGRT